MKKIIFTDCFNTLIYRRKSAKEVLLDWAVALGEKYSIEPAVIYHFFTKIMFELGLNNFLHFHEAEVRFDDILTQTCNIFAKNIKDFDVSDFKQDALKLYIKAEQDSHYLNEKLVKLIADCKASGSKVYLLSEFYCGRDVINSFLINLGIRELFDDIFVSCDYMKSKRTGALYRHVIKELSINHKDIVMYGDSIISDIMGANMVRIRAKKVKAKIPKPTKEVKQKIKLGTSHKTYDEIFEMFGDKYNYSNYAFPLYLFTKRLHAELEKKEIKDVFFLSREGYFLKRLFDKFCELTGQGQDIKTHYLVVSRNSVYRANFKPIKEQDFSYLSEKKWRMSVYEFVKSLDFSDDEMLRVENELNFDIKKKHRNFGTCKVFKNLVKTDTFQQIYEEKRGGVGEAFDAYLKSFGVDFEKDGLTVVDVGWRGSMQNLIYKHLNGKVSITGYYIGLTAFPFVKENEAYAAINGDKYGLLYQKNNKKQLGNKLFYPIILTEEQICRAPHNRAESYKMENGVATVTLSSLPPDDKLLHDKYILSMQNQIEAKLAKLCELEVKNLSLIEPYAIKMSYKMLKKSSKYDLKFLEEAHDSYYDSFGSVGFSIQFNPVLRKAAFKALDLLFRIRCFGVNKRVIKDYYNQLAFKKPKCSIKIRHNKEIEVTKTAV